MNSTFNNITGNFINNSVYASSSSESNSATADGGAIYLYKGKINNITGDFINNIASSNAQNAYAQTLGGALSNDEGKIGNIKGDFINNVANAYCVNGQAIALGGAIFNNYKNCILGNLTGLFMNNSASAYTQNESGYSAAAGGAIYNDCIIGEKDLDGNIIGGIINSSFFNNRAISNKDIAQGGAIYTTKSLNIIADNGVSEFTGNYTQVVDVRDDNAIYIEGAENKLSLISRNNGKIILNDNIDGAKGYTVSVDGDNTGSLHLFNDIRNANVEMGNITLNTVNNSIRDYNFDSFTLTNDINYTADVDLANSTMDRITAENYGAHSGNINVVGFNLLSDANSDSTEILFAEAGLKDNIVDQLADKSFTFSPIYKYSVNYDNREDGGYYIFDRVAQPSGSSDSPSYDSFNPAVVANSVATQAIALSSMNQTIRTTFHHTDVFSSLPLKVKLAAIHKNKYAIAEGKNVYSPDLDILNKSAWVQPYTSFESIDLNNGPKVDAISYGSLVGFNGDFRELGRGWYGMSNVYAGYNGLHLNHDGVSTNFNGGVLGMTETFYKGNFFSALSATVGAGVGTSSTMYGSEDYTQLLSGIGSKSGYNFEFKEGKYILQPALFMSYSFINTFDYTNAAGVKIESDPLHTLTLNPSLKFIANLKNGWQPYASVGLVSNVMNINKVRANDVVLPKMTVDPYVEYGVGVKRVWKDRFSGFLQAMVRNGGRNGVALSFGFKWSLGKESL